MADHVQKLWEAKSIKNAFERNNELQLPGGSSGAEYFFKEAKRFAAEDYLPTQEDVIRYQAPLPVLCSSFLNSLL